MVVIVELSHSCPMENQYLTPLIVYCANVSNNKDNETNFYYGLTNTSFKERYGSHKRSFRHGRYKNDTELSKYIWDLTVLIRLQPLNTVLFGKYTETQNKTSARYV